MTITLVQSVTGSGATLVLNGVAAGNALICIASTFRAPSTGVAAAIPSDSNGTFSVASADTPSTFTSGTTDDCGVAIWYQANAAAGTHTVTPEALNGFDATLVEFSGLATSGVFDVAKSAVTNNGTQTSQVTGTTAATAQADELVIIGLALAAAAGVANVGLTDPVSGFQTLLINQTDSTGIACLHAFKVISATGTQTATFNWTDNEASQASHGAIATFIGAGTSTTVWSSLGTGDGPGASPGTDSARFQPSMWWPYATSNVTQINETIGLYSWLGLNSPLSKEIVSTLGVYTWTGKTSPLSAQLVSTTGKYTWLGKQSPLSVELVSLIGQYSWAGKTSSLSKIVAETIGRHTWGGTSSQLSTLVAEILASYTWRGLTSVVTVPGTGGTVVIFYDGLSVADGLTYHKGLSRPTIVLTPVGDGTYTVTKLSSLSDDDPANLNKETYTLDGDLP